jgi:hypothetical protein
MIIKAELTVFAAAFVAEAGRDAWKGLKYLVTQVFELRRRPDRPEGSIRVDEADRIVILDDRIPDEGLRQLTEVARRPAATSSGTRTRGAGSSTEHPGGRAAN